MQTLESRIASGHLIQKLNYDYDALGNVTSLRNDIPKPGWNGPEAGGPTVQTYAYDDLSRLTSATGEYRGRDDKANRYQLTMAYDTIHNTTLKDQKHHINNHTVGQTTYRNPYTYNSGHPHAPSAVGAQEIRYDANGNLTYRAEGSKRRQQIWDDENRLACTHEGKSLTIPRDQASCTANADPAVRFSYDDKGTRVVKDAGGSVNIYPSLGFSERAGHSESTRFKHIFVGGQRLATKVVRNSGKETQQFYFHADQAGSMGYVTDASGDITDHNEYFPSGESWVNERSSQAGQYQFSGKELDEETGLYYFGGRYYDPRSTNWQSTDPALEDYLPSTDTREEPKLSGDGGAYNPGNLGVYGYARQNPLRFTDPDGRQAAELTMGTGMSFGGGALAIGGSAAAATALGPLALTVGGAYLLGKAAPAFPTDPNDPVLVNARSVADKLYPDVLPAAYLDQAFERRATERETRRALTIWLSRSIPQSQSDDQTIPTLVIDANKMPNIARGIRAAFDKKAPQVLNVNKDRLWQVANRILACGAHPGPQSCDEYPFASTMQGGLGSHTTDVPLQENRIQGGVIRAFYSKLKHGDQFRVVVAGPRD